METTISTGLRRSDIVPLFHKSYIIVTENRVSQHVYIILKRTDYSHSSYIEDPFFYALYSQRYALSSCLLIYMVQAFKAGGDTLNRVSVMRKRELLVKNPEFCLHFHHCTSIKGKKLTHWISGALETLHHLFLHFLSQLSLSILYTTDNR